MTHLQAVMTSRGKELVADDKFDRHMKRARVNDIKSRRVIFDRQTEEGVAAAERRKNIQSSIY